MNNDRGMSQQDLAQFIAGSMKELVGQSANCFLLVSKTGRIEPNEIFIGSHQVRHMRHGFLHGSLQHKPPSKNGFEDNETSGHPVEQIGYYIRPLKSDGSNDWSAALIGTNESEIKYSGGEVRKIDLPSTGPVTLHATSPIRGQSRRTLNSPTNGLGSN